MADQKLTALSALSALTGDDLLYAVDDVAGTPTSYKVTAAVVREFSNMTQATGTDADTTMAVNTLYVVDMSAWATADRTYTLPATAAVGDRIGVMVTAGDASHELILTAGSGDTLNGIAGGTEWSRVFITGEVVVMRCVVANTTWVVEVDGRIPIQARSTAAGSGSTTQSISAATYTLVNANLMTEEVDNSSSMGSDGGSKLRFTARRAGQFSISGGGYLSLTEDQKTYIGAIALNGEAVPITKLWRVWSSGTGGAMANTGVNGKALAVDDYINLAVYQGGTGAFNLQDNAGFTFLSVTEVL